MPEPICLLWTRISEVFDTNEILLMENLSRKYFNFPAFSPLEICEDGGIMIGKCDDSSSLQPLLQHLDMFVRYRTTIRILYQGCQLSWTY